MFNVNLAWFFMPVFAGMTMTAAAGPKLDVKIKEYEVRGTTGSEIMREINRKGPKHGFLVRAIAQTRYTLNYTYDADQLRDACRIRNAHVELKMTYIYPALGNKVSSSIQRRWQQFIAEVREHEEVHGDLAIKMAHATEAAILSTSRKGKYGCGSIKRDIDRKVSKVFDKYETEQRRFDRKEHRKNGNVDRMIAELVKN